jgi:molecular chaperone DnaJ
MIPSGTQSGTWLRLRGKGMPRLHSGAKADLYLLVLVMTPTHLTPRQRDLLKEFRDHHDTRQRGNLEKDIPL